MNQPITGGLSSAEVAQRIHAGQVNRTPRSELRDYAQIVARNLFNWLARPRASVPVASCRSH